MKRPDGSVVRNKHGEVLLKFDMQIDQAAEAGDNDLCLELVRDQKEWYEYFGYGEREEVFEYYRRVKREYD